MSIKCVREECFGNKFGYCAVLCEGFGRKPCPFFKTKEQHRADVARKNARLIRLGMYGAMQKTYETRDYKYDDTD